ncbi:C4-dicarboxylate TRAP transporter large permease protein DctM (plasmid) [Pseudosulfitobacter pseudonitzschiae]|jgi:tripartite ATP-independent transporter DctM subunit|uniref:TRAP transporter large permease protein n=1 Tax=Pseudosulfitobacter pseudonitzschiae TaxID=1402135 RepID=A0A221K8G6_9RHOB|nr:MULTISPECIES: TRAP transporter large permease [Roseobacteraceae]ASM75304.1 C4-dicarboxylate TRAP transporter large permease protein DctM [Pseudosulfitobacter pseudonitzschiae]|tara:strand:+ start:10626 stop:11933 length:1308 start_codon:yes stop_codon:yes gene_type:complete
MTDVQIGYAGVAVLLALIAFRVPIGLALISVSFGGIFILVGERPAFGALGVFPYAFSATWHLSSIPMFVLMGFFCFHAGLTKGLFGAARLWLSALPGGLAIAGVLGSAGFAAVTGSSVACAAAMGRIAVPEMLRYRYDPGLAAGSIAAAGTIGALIPPSILFILYGIIVKVQVGQLFLGGLAVGLLTATAYSAVIIVRVVRNPDLAPPIAEEISWKMRLVALADVWPVLVLVLGVFGGLFAGVFTPTEAGGVGAAMSLTIAFFKRSIDLRGIWSSLMETLTISSSIFIIAIGASMLTRFFAYSGAGDEIAAIVQGMGVSPLLLIMVVALLYILLGMFLEPIGAMLLTMPILLPLIETAEINLLWFGILVVKLLEIGMITPPIGLNVFVLKSVMGEQISTSTIFRGVMWFIFADILILGLMVAFPDLVLYLPSLLQ